MSPEMTILTSIVDYRLDLNALRQSINQRRDLIQSGYIRCIAQEDYEALCDELEGLDYAIDVLDLEIRDVFSNQRQYEAIINAA